ncbi:MAG: hypothetical protein A3J38_02735 [Gammaproteobacteria bacterium RIFCSPHIGHO2_12_FULL_45_9]|nr:MAG: hypothetical protein A3J38_02735 [Gammaproteobacteria bacterium RIFCSPHIGHO2_12_FULL_45_9]
MQKTSVFLVCLGLVGISGTPIAADLPSICPADSVHCAATSDSGTSPGSVWIKTTMGTLGVYTACFPANGFSIALTPSELQTLVQNGQIKFDAATSTTMMTLEFNQCKDQSCSETKPLGMDTFQLSVNPQDHTAFTAAPQFYLIKTPDITYGACSRSKTMTKRTITHLGG